MHAGVCGMHQHCSLIRLALGAGDIFRGSSVGTACHQGPVRQRMQIVSVLNRTIVLLNLTVSLQVLFLSISNVTLLRHAVYL